MNVDRPAGIPAGIDSEEFGRPVLVAHLIAPQKLPSAGIEATLAIPHVGVDAQGIAMPDVHQSAG